MRFGQQCEPVVFQTLDQVDLPQWPRVVQSWGQYAADELLELDQSAWPRQRRPSHMEGEVEVFIVDPHWSSEPRWDPAHPLPIARHEGESFADQRDQPFVIEALRTGIENVQGTYMAWGMCRVQGKQRHLERREPLRHGSLPVRANPWSNYGTTAENHDPSGQPRNPITATHHGNPVKTTFVEDGWIMARGERREVRAWVVPRTSRQFEGEGHQHAGEKCDDRRDGGPRPIAE